MSESVCAKVLAKILSQACVESIQFSGCVSDTKRQIEFFRGGDRPTDFNK